jgi:predicted outer membrane repeat protein
VIEACVFTGNRSDLGGGMFTDVGGFVGLRVVDCTFASNFAQDRGGGIFCSVFSKSRFERIAVWGNCALDAGPEVSVEFGGSATFACSIIDTSGVYSEGVLSYEGEDNLLGVDPGFCAPDTCTSAPTAEGDYGVGDESLSIARNSPCGARIGGIGRGACGSTNPVVKTSWGALKGILGRSTGSNK